MEATLIDFLGGAAGGGSEVPHFCIKIVRVTISDFLVQKTEYIYYVSKVRLCNKNFTYLTSHITLFSVLFLNRLQ